MSQINVFWFRRDLRLNDNAGLYNALKSNLQILPIFIFDPNILDKLENKKDARVTFIHQTLEKIKSDLEALGSSLLVKYGDPASVWSELAKENSIHTVFTNHDYEPYALERDKNVGEFLKSQNIDFQTFKDHVIFEKSEVVKDDGTPYTVFTPYSKKWKAKLQSEMVENEGLDSSQNLISYFLKPYETEKYFPNFIQTSPFSTISLEEMGFQKSAQRIPPVEISRGIIKNYAEQRNFPAVQGTTRLGIHFRFGTISIREKALKAMSLSEVFLNELIWRDFYAMILSHFPHVSKNAFRPNYEKIAWRADVNDFKKWCNGVTGYPIVDAGMRELNTTGFMHNRVRMIVASFLTKHLLIDWRWGEAYFAEKLLDFDMASNSGGWQWAAGCGTDAAPYFRIFNPDSQQIKFDSKKEYIKNWVKEFDTPSYPKPMVEHKFARERCLATYKAALGNSSETGS